MPERMQLATASLVANAALSLQEPLTPADLPGAAMWVTQRLSVHKTREYFAPDGQFYEYNGQLVLAVTYTLRRLFLDHLEVPYIWAHKRDYISHFDNNQPERKRLELLSLSDLWRIYALGQKYRSLVNRRNALSAMYERLQINDRYFEEEILPNIEGVEVVADATEWLSMMYKGKKPEEAFRFHDDDEEVTTEVKKHKTPSRVSVYEVTKRSVVAKLAEVRLIHIVMISPNANVIQPTAIWHQIARDCHELCRTETYPVYRQSGIKSSRMCRAICRPRSGQSPPGRRATSPGSFDSCHRTRQGSLAQKSCPANLQG